MAKKAESSTALTKAEQKEVNALSELSDFFDSVDIDGMEEVGGEDIKLAVKLFNMGGLDAGGNQRRKNTFFDNLTEETQETIGCVFLITQKTHRWDEYDNDKKKTNVLCDSPDRISGKLRENGEIRPCKDCPDTGWFNDEDGKPFKKCGEVHNVVSIERLTQRPFLIRFKKTALKAWRNYLMQNHYGARRTANGRGNIPLFAFECHLSTKMDDSGNFALPVFERGQVLTKDEMNNMYENAKGYLEMMAEVVKHADVVESKHTADERDSGLTSDEFVDE